MSHDHEISLATRMADLDTQRHVTSRTYESFCFEGRFRLLEANGHDDKRLREEGALLRPLAAYVRFANEQHAGAVLRVRTRAFAEEGGVIYWDQTVEQQDGKPACRIIQVTRSETNSGTIDLLAPGHEFPEKNLLSEASPFSGSCERIVSPYIMGHSERTHFGDYPPSALWRIVEDGRYMFGERLGLTYELMIRMDTTTFFMGGVFHFHELPVPGEEMRVHSWVERIDKIRVRMRQDVTSTRDEKEKLLLSISEEQLVVSLARARPRKPPPEYIGLIEPYLEHA